MIKLIFITIICFCPCLYGSENFSSLGIKWTDSPSVVRSKLKNKKFKISEDYRDRTEDFWTREPLVLNFYDEIYSNDVVVRDVGKKIEGEKVIAFSGDKSSLIKKCWFIFSNTKKLLWYHLRMEDNYDEVEDVLESLKKKYGQPSQTENKINIWRKGDEQLLSSGNPVNRIIYMNLKNVKENSKLEKEIVEKQIEKDNNAILCTFINKSKEGFYHPQGITFDGYKKTIISKFQKRIEKSPFSEKPLGIANDQFFCVASKDSTQNCVELNNLAQKLGTDSYENFVLEGYKGCDSIGSDMLGSNVNLFFGKMNQKLMVIKMELDRDWSHRIIGLLENKLGEKEGLCWYDENSIVCIFNGSVYYINKPNIEDNLAKTPVKKKVKVDI
jgi:hypothetical protein